MSGEFETITLDGREVAVLRSIARRLRDRRLIETRLVEHPGHSDQKVHGRRGSAVPLKSMPISGWQSPIRSLVDGDKDAAAMGMAKSLWLHPKRIEALADSPDLGYLLEAGRDYAHDRYTNDHLDPDSGAFTGDRGTWGELDSYARNWKTMSPMDRRMALTDPHLGEYVLYAASAGVISQWATTAGDSHPRALAYQMAVAAEFKLPKHIVNEDGVFTPAMVAGKLTPEVERNSPVHGAAGFYDRNGAGLRALARTNYELTQEGFAKAGITSVKVVRGVSHIPLPVPRTQNRFSNDAEQMRDSTWTGRITQNPLSSWSVDVDTAKGFGGYVLSMEVPVRKVFSTPVFGAGCSNEYEVILLGGPYNVTVSDVW